MSQHHMRSTSLEAWREVQPKIGRRQRQILRYLGTASRAGLNLTNMELAEGLGWSVNRVTPRVLELRKKGRVELAEKRRCRITGRFAMAWKVKK